MAIQFNQSYTIQRIHQSDVNMEITERLYDLGFTEGMQIVVEKRLPLGGPWIISSSTLYVALRDEEFQRLELK